MKQAEAALFEASVRMDAYLRPVFFAVVFLIFFKTGLWQAGFLDREVYMDATKLTGGFGLGFFITRWRIGQALSSVVVSFAQPNTGGAER